MTGEYLHLCSRCGAEFYSADWYLGGNCHCPKCKEEWQQEYPDDALRMAENAAARKLREQRDREYDKNPPKTTVTVENGARVERRGTMPIGANAGGSLFKIDF